MTKVIGLAAAVEVVAPAPTRSQFDLRVLVAEDNAISLRIARTFLGKFGIEPEVAENGRIAVQGWEQHDPDLVLMDIQVRLSLRSLWRRLDQS